MKKKYEGFVIGFALFSMFFGAGNLIFPPSLGLISGNSWFMSMLGFLITGVGLPFLAIFALTKTKGSIYNFAGKVSKTFSIVFNSALILSIGPLLAMPRTGATTFEMGVLPFFPNFNPWIFSALFFGLTLFFAIKPSKILDRLGKFLTPVILIILAMIIAKGLFVPFGSINSETVLNSPFSKGFLEGYQTMDTLAGIIFGAVIIDLIRNKGYEGAEHTSILFKSSLIAALGLGIVYAGLIFLGARTGSLYEVGIGRTILLGNLATLTLGIGGKYLLGILVAFACLTTSVGLAATVGSFFSKHTKASYEQIVIVTCIFSTIVANFGVDMIVKLSIPILVFIFPISITLIVLNVFGNVLRTRGTYIGGVLGASIIGGIEALGVMKIESEFLSKIYNAMPLSEAGYAWIVPAIVGAVIFTFIIRTSVNENE
jgi:LIVCS family branched-chain amino acid:cation transporter